MADEGQVSMGMTADAGDVLRALDRILQKQNQLTGGVKQTKQASDGFTGSLASGLGNVGGQIASMVTGFVSVGGAIRVANDVLERFKKDAVASVEAIKAFQKEYVNFQFIGGHYKDPGHRERVLKESVRLGTMPTETAAAGYGWQSMTGHLDDKPEQRAKLWAALTKFQKTMNVPTQDLVPIFGKMSSFFPDLTAQEVSNNAQYLLEKGSIKTPAALAAVAPKIFAAGGEIGKMSAAQTSGMAAFMTIKTGTPDLAASGMEQLTRKVMFEDEEENTAAQQLAFGEVDPRKKRQSLLKAAGVVDSDNALQRLLKLAKAMPEGGYTPTQMKGIVSEESVKYLAPLLKDAALLERMAADFEKQTGPGIDRVGDMLNIIDQTDKTFRVDEAKKRHEAALFAAQQKDIGSTVWDTARTHLSTVRREHGKSEEMNFVDKWFSDIAQWRSPSEGGAVDWLRSELSATFGFRSPQMKSVSELEKSLGITSGDLPDRLNRSAENIFESSETMKESSETMKEAAGALKGAARRTADANSHVETPE